MDAHRIRSRLRETVSAINAEEKMAHAETLKNGKAGVGGLIRQNREVHARRPQALEGFANTGIETGVDQRMVPIPREEVGKRLLEIRFRRFRTECPANQKRNSVADIRVDQVVGEWATSHIGTGSVDGFRQVAFGIDQRAVEVENGECRFQLVSCPFHGEKSQRRLLLATSTCDRVALAGVARRRCAGRRRSPGRANEFLDGNTAGIMPAKETLSTVGSAGLLNPLFRQPGTPQTLP